MFRNCTRACARAVSALNAVENGVLGQKLADKAYSKRYVSLTAINCDPIRGQPVGSEQNFAPTETGK